MICKSCKNKNICKHYEYFKNIDIDIAIQITKCESYIGSNNQAIHRIEEPRPFRQPLPSRAVNDDDEEEIIDNEEKIYVNMDECNEPQNVTIVDLFMKGDKNND